jgi:hypothetical protein
LLQRLLTHGPQSVERYVSPFYALYEFFSDMLSAFMISAVPQASEDFLERDFHRQGCASVNFHHHRSNRVFSLGFTENTRVESRLSIQRRSRSAHTLVLRSRTWASAARLRIRGKPTPTDQGRNPSAKRRQ